MGIKTELETVFICEVCGHKWTSNKFTKEDPPVCCAGCKTSYWNRSKSK